MNSYFNNLVYHDGIYSSTKTSSVFYPLAGNNTFYNVEDNSFWFRHRNNCILEVIKKFQTKGNIFEIGGGNGYVSKAIQDNGFDVILIEPDIHGVKNAKHRGVSNLICCSFFDLEWTEKKIENAAIFDVLEHIEKDIEFLQQMGSHLMNGGLLFLTAPSNNALYSIEDIHDGHFRRYSLTELRRIISLSGFEIEYSSYIFAYLLFPVYLLKALPSQLHLGKYKSLEKYINVQSQHKYQAEHEVKSKLVDKVLDFFHGYELKKIQNLAKIPFGTSCLIVARKKNK